MQHPTLGLPNHPAKNPNLFLRIFPLATQYLQAFLRVGIKNGL